MDELGFNKIAAAVLVTALGYMFIREVPHLLTHVESPDVPAYALEIPEVGEAGPAVEIPFPSADFIAAMNAADGEKQFKKCSSCHNAEKGGANGTGPNLYGIVGAPAAQHAGFAYSSAMSGSGVTWDYESLDKFLTKPSKYISGTAMNYIGVKKEEQRAALIEYLRLKADTPLAPPVAAAMPGEEAEDVMMAEETTEDSAAESPAETPAPQETTEEESASEETAPEEETTEQ